MGEAGLFSPDQRLELLDGDIIEMTPIGHPHVHCVMWLTRWFVMSVGDRAVLSVQGSMRLSDLSEPEPDLLLLRPPDDVYRTRLARSEDVLLLIEVAQSSTRFDREIKRPLYAAAGIPEVWLIDLHVQAVEVSTDPSADGYRQVRTVVSHERLSPRAFPDLSLPLGELFGS